MTDGEGLYFVELRNLANLLKGRDVAGRIFWNMAAIDATIFYLDELIEHLKKENV